MATLEERCAQRKFVKSNVRYYSYKGREHDLFIALPDYSDLQRCFEIIFDKTGQAAPYIKFRKKRYDLVEAPLLTEDRGYFCIQGKFKGSKGLHKIPLHKLAYTAFYGAPQVGYHIHHIDRNKHNNAADNLVALTEGEHSTVHQRDVSVPRNLFTKLPKKASLLQQKREYTGIGEFTMSQSIQEHKMISDVEEIDKKAQSLTLTGPLDMSKLGIKQEEAFSIGAFEQPKILMPADVAIALSAEYSEQAMKVAIAKVFEFRLRRIREKGTPMTVLDVLCEMVNKEE